MFDIKWIREHPQDFDQARARRRLPPLADELLQYDREYRQALTRLQEAQNDRNALSAEFGQKRKAGADTQRLAAALAAAKAHITAYEQESEALAQTLQDKLSTEPNMPGDDVPDGVDEKGNILVRQWGDIPAFPFTPRHHFELGEKWDAMSFDQAAKLSGSRFVVLKGELARLERALGQFMIDWHVREFGYTEIAPPFLVRSETMYGTGQLPKFADDLFQTGGGLWLIPTAEVSLTNLVAEEILDAEQLPLRFTALTPCFRAEAGAAGKDTRGMIRQHQFHKVELVSITHPDQSAAEHERMTGCAEAILQALNLPYRVMLLCAGDMGFAARKTYDLEVWLPGAQTYREISSCSHCGDFQARRMKARFRSASGKGTEFVHTLNGSALALGRTLAAVMENGQQADGSIRVPEKLQPFMGGLEVIGAR